MITRFSPAAYADGVVVNGSPEVSDVAVVTPPEVVSAAPFLDPYGGEQHIVKEYHGFPSVLKILKGADVLCGTDNFLLGSINEADHEKMSLVFSLGDPIMFGGQGRKPRVFSYAGFLLDVAAPQTPKTGNPQIKPQIKALGKGISLWRKMYNRYLRGTKCREMGAVADLSFRDQWRRGYLTSTSMVYEANRPQIASFSFNMFIIDMIP